MTSQNLLPPEPRSLWLYGVERDGMNSPLWRNSKSWFDRNKFDEWKRIKRDFTNNEVISNPWIGITYQGGSYIYYLRVEEGNKTAQGVDLFNPSEKLQGLWELVHSSDVGDMLRISFPNQSVKYEIVANLKSPVHSGIVYKGRAPSSYVRFLPIS